jgi:hypothetical protein
LFGFSVIISPVPPDWDAFELLFEDCPGCEAPALKRPATEIIAIFAH